MSSTFRERWTLTSEPGWLGLDLADIDQADLRRDRVAVTRSAPGRLLVDGREYLDFASNDYLGLAADPRVTAAVQKFLETNGWGAGASPLITGYHPAHAALEKDLADFEGSDQVLLFGSGFVANFGMLGALAGPADILFSEVRNHASLIDGCRLSKATIHRYSSHRLDDLEEHLARAAGYRRRIIVTDSVFSMEGDIAPLRELCGLAKRYEALLYVDEAHATGILGATGRGAAEELGIEDQIPLRMGTLSKALGSVGAFVVASPAWCEWLMHRARPYVYSTALPPACAVAAQASLAIVRQEPERRQRLSAMAAWLREELASAGIDTFGSTTAIVPVAVGDPKRTVETAARLRDAGFWVGAIRPPTVPTGTSRLRVSLSAAHEMAEIEQLAWLLRKSICGKH